MLRVYNSLKGKKEVFQPIEAGTCRLYVCGMTVYDHCHIGHARSVIAFDVIVRFLKALGYDVLYVRNITDVDDKIITRALSEGVDSLDVSQKYTASMWEDFKALGTLSPTLEPRATDSMGDIIAMIERLIECGAAYVTPRGDVYFSVRQFKGYGKLSGQSLEELKSGVRIEVAADKKDPLDFALWKVKKPGEPAWDSPWGEGRPGWHIECSAMSKKCLGEQFDIHGGGSDLRFPHHENEIAQSEMANGCSFANYWIHTGMLKVEGEKMSKSLGNFFTIKEVLACVDPETLRYLMLTAHYRSALNYSKEAIESAHQALNRLYLTLRSVDLPEEGASSVSREASRYTSQFFEVMSDDFNTPEALAIFFEMSREINTLVAQGQQGKAIQIARELKGLGALLGLLQQSPEVFLQQGAEGADVEEITALVREREVARAARDWARADDIRNQLDARGILLEDGSDGTQWRRV